MKNRTRIICLVLIAAMLLSGCAGAKREQATQVVGKSVVDCSGRTVELPESVDSIACLYAYTGHLSVLLGCEDRISAVVKGLKRDHLMERKIENLADMPCPYNAGAINIEELAAVSPDVIFLRVETLADAGEVEKLDGLGIPYVFFDYLTMEDQINSIDLMGQCLGMENRAQEYIKYYRDTIDMVKGRIADIPESERKRVYHSENEVVRTDIPGRLAYEILDAAGCINVVTENDELRIDGDKGLATVEQIYVWDPDVILANEPDAVRYFNNDDKFVGLRAVQSGEVYQLPVGISRWGHPGSIESPLASLYIAQLLYPEKFSDIDIRAEIRDFYETWFTIILTDEDIDMIISGEGMRQAKD